MSGYRLEFGYHPTLPQFQLGPILFEPLPDCAAKVAVVQSYGAEHDWLYPPLQPVRSFSGESGQRPYPARVFGLPKTHALCHRDAIGEEHLIFHLWTLSFFEGMRLTHHEAGFLDATPIKPHKLVDFIQVSPRENATALVEEFWNKNTYGAHVVKLIESAINALFLSQNPRYLQFEMFSLLYTAVDICYRLSVSIHEKEIKKAISHAARIEAMCSFFEIPIPRWASAQDAQAAKLRNETVHEGLFGGEPLGFAVQAQNDLPLQMKALICRIIVALLGARDTTYIRSPIDTGEVHGLSL